MTITTRKTTIDLSEEETNSITQTIAILRGLESANLCDDDYNELTMGIYQNLGDVIETLNTLLANLCNFTPTKENIQETDW